MANLVIKKNTNSTFTFILDGDTDNAVIDNQPNMTSTGVYFNFKTKNGANIIKKQFIQYSQITYKNVSDVEFTFLSVQEVWTKLINEGFFDYLGTSGGGGGVDRFDALLDTFSYIGNNGKVPVVDQSQLKLVPTTFYNFKDFIQLEDVAISELVEDKIISVALVSGVPKLVLKDNPADPVQLANTIGYFKYADETTSTTPIIILPSTDTLVTNDTLGTTTLTSNAPYGISSVFNPSTNSFDFSELSIGDQIEITVNVSVETTSSNQSIKGILKVAEGSLVQENKVFFEDEFLLADTYDITRTTSLSIDNDSIRLDTTSLYFNSNDDAYLGVNYFYIKITRKGVNVVDVNLIVNDAISQDSYNDIILGSDGKLYVGGLVKKSYASGYSYSSGTTDAVFTLRPEGQSVYNFTNAGLVSISGFDLSLMTGAAETPYEGKLIRLINSTGHDVTLNENDDTNAEVPFLLKEGVNLVWPANEIIEFAFSGNILSETFRSWDSFSLTEDSFGDFANGLTTEDVLVDGDIFNYTDVSDSNKQKKTTWSNIKSKLKTYFDTLYQVILTDVNFGAFINSLTSKTTPVDTDQIGLMDSVDSNKQKKVSLTNLKAYLKTYFDSFYLDSYSVFIQANNITFSALNTWYSSQVIFGFGTTSYGTSATPNSNFPLNSGYLPIRPGYKLTGVTYGMFFKSSNTLSSTIEIFIQVVGVAAEIVGNAGSTVVTVTQQSITSGSGTSNPKFLKNLTVANYSLTEAQSYLQFSVRETSNLNTLGLNLQFKFEKI